MFKGLVGTPGTTTSLSDYRRFGRMPNHVRFVIPSQGSPNACGTANRVTKYESAHLCHLPPEIDIKVTLAPLTFRSVSIHDERGQLEDIAKYIKSVINTDPKCQRWRDEDKQLVIDVLTERAYGR